MLPCALRPCPGRSPAAACDSDIRTSHRRAKRSVRNDTRHPHLRGEAPRDPMRPHWGRAWYTSRRADASWHAAALGEGRATHISFALSFWQ